MRLTRIYVPLPLPVGQALDLPAGPTRHLVSVLRLPAGAPLILFNGDGRDCQARLLHADRRAARVRVESAGDREPPPPLAIGLALGIARGERMELALRQAAELGVTRIVPLLTERGLARLEPDRLASRLERWRGILIGACEQCGRRSLPELSAPSALADWLASVPPGGLLLDPRAARALTDCPAPAGETILLVGPEGGLSPREQSDALAAGFMGVRLGPRILRAETAPLAAIAVMQALWGDFRAAV